MASKNKIALAAAMEQLQTFISTHAETTVSDTVEFEGGVLTLNSYSDHASFAAALFCVTEGAGEMRKTVVNRSNACKHKISQFRYATVAFTDGLVFEKIGLSAIQEKDSVRIDTPIDLSFAKAFFTITNPEFLVVFLSNYHVNMNYSQLPHVPTGAELSEKYPKLAELAALDGVNIKVKAKNLAHVTFTSVDALDDFFIKATHLQTSDNVRLGSQNIYVRNAGSSDEFGSMARGMFKQILSDKFDSLEVYAILTLV